MIKELSYVIAIAEKGNVSKAAESLFISQPSLSKYLKNLEDHLGAPLFNRRDGGYYPTYLGERYLHYAKRIVAYGDEWNREHDDITHREHCHSPHAGQHPDPAHADAVSQPLSICDVQH